MSELGVLTRERVRLATGLTLSDQDADELARFVMRSGVEVEIAMAALARHVAIDPADLVAALRTFADETPGA